MLRPLHLWLLLVPCLAVIAAAMGYISVEALRLEASDAQARHLAEQEGRIRTALWRMDYALAPLITQENIRPYGDYSAFFPALRAYNRVYTQLSEGEVLVPSPLLGIDSPLVELYFQVGPDGAVTSPQVPTGPQRELALANYVAADQVDRAAARLAELAPALDRRTLLAEVPAADPPPPPFAADDLTLSLAPTKSPAGNRSVAQAQAEAPQRLAQRLDPQAQAPAQQAAQAQSADPVQVAQQRLNDREWQARNTGYNTNVANAMVQSGANSSILNGGVLATYSTLGVNPVQPRDLLPTVGSTGHVLKSQTPAALLYIREGPVQPLWVGTRLVLLRQVAVNSQIMLQGCWLNWPAVQALLLERVRDLLPEARVVPVVNGTAASATRMLAGFPLELLPGAVPVELPAAWSPVRVTLAVAWAGAVLGTLAVLALLVGTQRLSERRAAFVSAVTHELRTPLTTLRLYTDMLERGMVRDDDQRRGYLRTLRTEADRLGQLVANVLSFARLERGRNGVNVSRVGLADLLAGVRERLAQRAEQAGMALAIEPVAAELAVRADTAAVEQILFNLVDNACKYAAGAADKRIELTARAAEGTVTLCLADHGPGVDAAVRGRLFTPFCKSAREAAHSAPGVGLGLALSQRLARQMGGELALCRDHAPGACFTLRLPRA